MNKMKPSNLGIVFGPTLLRSETDTLVCVHVMTVNIYSTTCFRYS